MKKFFKTLLTISLFALPALAYTELTATLTKISDGDTMSFSSNGDEFKCRLYGIDTPEKFKTAKFFKDMQNTGASEKELEFAGQAATNYAKNKLFNDFSDGLNSENFIIWRIKFEFKRGAEGKFWATAARWGYGKESQI